MKEEINPVHVRRFIMLIKGVAPCAMSHIFVSGGCYRFYLILKVAFPSAQAYWNKERNHVVSRIAGKYWDIYGNYDNDDVDRKLNAEDHKTAALFHFDEVAYVTKTIREYMNGDET